jgi:hypothetical protein
VTGYVLLGALSFVAWGIAIVGLARRDIGV